MKKVVFLFIATAMVAVMSAFTSTAKLTDEYVLIDGRYELVSEQPVGGHCDSQLNSTCKYQKIADNGTDPYTEPGNFSALDSNQVWVP